MPCDPFCGGRFHDVVNNSVDLGSVGSPYEETSLFQIEMMNLDGRFYQNLFLVISLLPFFWGKCIDCRFRQHGCQENEGHDPLYSQWRWKTWGSYLLLMWAAEVRQCRWKEWLGEGGWTWAGTANRVTWGRGVGHQQEQLTGQMPKLF